MAKLVDEARSIVKDSGDSDKKISYCFMAWSTEDGDIATTLSTKRLGTGEGWYNDYHRFVDAAIETLQNSKIQY